MAHLGPEHLRLTHYAGHLKSDPDSGPAVRRIDDIHGRAVRGGDLPYQGEAHAATLALRGEERYEHLLALLRGDARAIIRHGDDDVSARLLVSGLRNI
jgi:hypothetical protein